MTTEPESMDTKSLMRGATITAIAELFHMDPRTVRRRLGTVSPVAKRGSLDLYAVHEVLEYLVDPRPDQIEQRVRRMNPQDLPPLLQKEFWNALRARQHFETEARQLYRVEAVSELITRLCSTLRMQILLLPDRIEREARLTSEQRAVVQREADSALAEMRDLVVTHFETPLQEPETLFRPGLTLSVQGDDPDDLG